MLGTLKAITTFILLWNVAWFSQSTEVPGERTLSGWRSDQHLLPARKPGPHCGDAILCYADRDKKFKNLKGLVRLRNSVRGTQ